MRAPVLRSGPVCSTMRGWPFLAVMVAVALTAARGQAALPGGKGRTAETSLAEAKLSPGFRHRVVLDLLDVADDDPEWTRDILQNSTVQMVRIGPGLPAVLRVDGGGQSCGATGNCPVLFYNLKSQRKILESGGFNVALLRAMHHGARDVIAHWNMSCCDGTVDLYRFDGARYWHVWQHNESYVDR